MVNASEIKPDAPVVCSDNAQFAVVDHMEGQDAIKLKKDKSGRHHYIPLSWVERIDDKVHIDRPGAQAMREWSTTPGGKRGADPAVARGNDRATNEGMAHPPA